MKSKPPVRAFQHSYHEIATQIEQQAPFLWERCYPRMYRNTDQYGSPKIPAITMAISTIAVATHGEMCSKTAKNVHIATCKLLKYDVPTLFIAPDLLQAVTHTTPPENLRWDSINLPFDAALLMLPNGWLSDPRDGPCAFIGYSKNRPGEPVSLPEGILPRGMHAAIEGVTSMSSFVVFTACHQSPYFPVMDYTINAEDSPFVGTKDFDRIYSPREVGMYDTKLSPEESSFVHEMLQLVFRVLLVLEARPSLISYGDRIGRHKKHRHLELWSPNIIGKDYRLPKLPSGILSADPDAHPRFHWVRGYTNRYRIGPRSAVTPTYRSHWIEPTPRGALYSIQFTDGSRKVMVTMDLKQPEDPVSRIIVDDSDGLGWRHLPRRDPKYIIYKNRATEKGK